MEPRKRNRKPVVCTVCRKRKIRCDRGKPACSACKKSNVSHLCTYEEPSWAAYEGGNSSGINDSSMTSPAPRSPFTFKPTATATAQIHHHQQQELQMQQQQFQQSLQNQILQQQNLKSQIAAKYGSNGKPLTGAATSTGSPIPQGPYPHHPGAGSPYPPQYPGQEYGWNANVQLPPIANQNYNQQHMQSELEYLKNRIVQIEGTMGVDAYQQQQHMPYAPYPQYPHQHQLQLQQQQQQAQQAQQQQLQLQQQHQVQVHPQQVPGAPVGYTNNGIQLPSINQIKPFFDPTKQQAGNQTSQDGQKSAIKSDPDENEANIDPTLLDESEIITSFKTNTPNSQYLKLENNGIFETVSFAKKDNFQTNFYLLLQSYQENLKNLKNLNGKSDDDGPLRKRIKLNDHFHNLLQNSKYQVEHFLKYESTNLNEIVKKIGRILPYKKISWLLIEKFFTSFADPFIPVINEDEFLSDITKVIGERELNDSKIKLNVDVNNSKDIVNLTYLLIVIRISSLSLENTIKLDKFNKFLLKNCPESNELDFTIKILLAYIQNFAIDKLTRIKLSLLEVFLFSKTGELSQASEFYSAGLAISLNLNNKSEIGSNEQLIKIWYHIYFQYYTLNIIKGMPLFLNDEFFNLELSNFSNGNLGLNFHKSILEFYSKQIELNKLTFKIWQHLYNDMNQELTVGNLESLLKKYDDHVLANFKDYDTYKKEINSNYSNKCFNLINNVTHKLTKMNLNCFILLHYENEKNKEKSKFIDLVKHISQIVIESVENSFDALKNYNSHFNSGYEFIVFPPLFLLIDKAIKYLTAIALRLWWIGRPSLAICKFFINMVDELEGFTFLDSYFSNWKIKNRVLITVNLFKEAYLKKEGHMPLLSKLIKFSDPSRDDVEFDDLFTNFKTFDNEELKQVEALFDTLNSKFDDKFKDVDTFEAFFAKLDFAVPDFDINYFY